MSKIKDDEARSLSCNGDTQLKAAQPVLCERDPDRDFFVCYNNQMNIQVLIRRRTTSVRMRMSADQTKETFQ